jgi:cell division protein FtsZ
MLGKNNLKKSNFMESAKIAVIGIGGGGCNTITHIMKTGLKEVSFVAINTNEKTLSESHIPTTVKLDTQMVAEFAAGHDDKTQNEIKNEIIRQLEQKHLSSDIVFLIACMGGGMGTVVIPLLADLLRERGILAIAVVTRPFSFEGTKRRSLAEEGISILENKVDTLIVIPNDRLLYLCDSKTSIEDAFHLMDTTLYRAVQFIVQAASSRGLMNLDFDNLKNILEKAGPTVFSIGEDPNSPIEAAKLAISSPLIDRLLEDASAIYYSISSGISIPAMEGIKAAQIVREAVRPDAKALFTIFTDSPDTNFRVALIASGFSRNDNKESDYVKDEHFYLRLGEQLKKAREEAGKTKKECGATIKLTTVGYSNYENGTRRIPIPRLKMLANYLGKNLSYFLDSSFRNNNEIPLFKGTPTFGLLSNRLSFNSSLDALSLKTSNPYGGISFYPVRNNMSMIDSQITPRKITHDFAPNYNYIINVVSQYFGVSTDLIRSNQKTQKISNARRIAIYLIRAQYNVSFAEIGKHLVKDPSTVFNAYNKISERLKTDNRLKNALRSIHDTILQDTNI